MPYEDIFEKFISPLRPIPTEIKPGGRIKRPVTAVVFDIYGTLFISESGGARMPRLSEDVEKRMGELIAPLGLNISPEVLIQTLFDAIETEHSRKKACGTDFPEVEIDRIWESILGIDDMEITRRFALAFELIVNPVYPMPHLDSLLSACSRAGLIMGLMSNAQFYTPFLFRHFCGAFPEELGFDPNLTIYSYQYGHAKPSPVLYTALAENLRRLGISPGSTLFMGNDMLNDVCAADAIGFQTALFAGDRRSLRLRTDDPRASALRPDLYITDLKQLPRMIGIE